jgi:phospholipid/cholesterol/gamma-HCH transport system ATP-binding protein
MIEVADITCEIEKNKQLFSDVSFSLPKGETMLILGSSGSGKTTLLKMISGLILPSSGSVFISDINQYGKQKKFAKKNIGMVFQNNALFDNLSTGENIAAPLKHLKKMSDRMARESVVELMEKVGLDDVFNKKITELSGGMQKRVAIARALAASPEYLFLDEPIQGLDPGTSRKIIELLALIKKDFSPTMILISNDLKYTMSLADKIAILEDKDLVVYNNMDEFKNSKDEAAKFYLRLSKRLIA